MNEGAKGRRSRIKAEADLTASTGFVHFEAIPVVHGRCLTAGVFSIK